MFSHVWKPDETLTLIFEIVHRNANLTNQKPLSLFTFQISTFPILFRLLWKASRHSLSQRSIENVLPKMSICSKMMTEDERGAFATCVARSIQTRVECFIDFTTC